MYQGSIIGLLGGEICDPGFKTPGWCSSAVFHSIGRE